MTEPTYLRNVCVTCGEPQLGAHYHESPEPECECSEEYGPCELHGTVLAQREGSAVRTGDELAALFIDDAADIIREAEPDAIGYSWADSAEVAADYWEANPNGGWADDPDMSQWLSDACNEMENALPAGVWVIWNDGYWITQVHDDCPLI